MDIPIQKTRYQFQLTYIFLIKYENSIASTTIIFVDLLNELSYGAGFDKDFY